MSIKQNITAMIFDKKGRILSIGKNSYVKTHPLQAEYAKKVGDPNKIYLHAEVAAIIRCRDLSKAYKIVITRVNVNGEFVLAKPCSICMRAIKESGITVIEHT